MRLYFVWAALLAAAPGLLAAPEPPVHWRVASAPHGTVKPGAKFAVTIAGTIDPGWHMYALEEPPGGPIATEVGLAESSPAEVLRVTGSKPRVLDDASFGMQTGQFENSAEFSLQLRAAPTTGSGQKINVLIRYQACNDQVCLPPHTDTVPVALP